MDCVSLSALAKRKIETGKDIVFDKDDSVCMNFIASTANLRAHIFGIEEKNYFEIKAMAGNIIPAIASTNAIVAGMIVLNAIKIISGNLKDCKTVKTPITSANNTDVMFHAIIWIYRHISHMEAEGKTCILTKIYCLPTNHVICAIIET